MQNKCYREYYVKFKCNIIFQIKRKKRFILFYGYCLFPEFNIVLFLQSRINYRYNFHNRSNYEILSPLIYLAPV